MHYLYKISDTLNNKVYIGQSKDPEKRWKQHKWLSNKIIKHQYIHRAIAKYGIDNFTFEVIATCISQEDADETEIILIKQYDSRNIEKGYNLGAGGNTNIPGEETRKKMSISAKQRIINYPNTNPGIFDNPAPSKETIEKIRLANLGRIQSQEEKNKRTQSLLKHYETHESPLIGKTSHMKGKQHTEETKQKITENLTGYKHTEKAKLNMSKSKIGNTNSVGRVPWNKDKIIGCKFSDEQIQQMKTLREEGLSYEKIADKLGCNWKSVVKWTKYPVKDAIGSQ